ncbi:orotidine 5'-phosphate decarboxylase / HUMPS family protein [Paenarthrobacter nicotinovorans]|uniref:orotidine 5'-phosphate decarboxylase / HUMPS family protein n=1 Tax=Paenarthrobacter nicotinovorans TaxID=29320 RepID=UPI003A7FD0EE
MKLQVAIDVPSMESALQLVTKVAEFVDIVALGAHLLQSSGLNVLSVVKEAYPDRLVLADLMALGGDGREVSSFFAAGADIVSVPGAADDSAIAGAVEAAAFRSKSVVVDLLGVKDKVVRAKEAHRLGANYVSFHAGVAERSTPDYEMNGLLRAGKESLVPFAVAGGVSLSNIEAVQRACADIAVVGRAICTADDPASAAQRIRNSILWRPVTASTRGS